MLQSSITSSTCRRLSGLLGIIAILVPISYAASPALDHAGNYAAGTFTNGSNGGTGFGEWIFSTGLSAQIDLTDSTLGSGDINSTNGSSFMVYGGTNNSYAEATRAFNEPLAAGDSFKVTCAYNFDGGARGLNILNASNNELLNINMGGGDALSYTFQGDSAVVISSDYNPTAIVQVIVKQLEGNQLELTLTRNDGIFTNVASTTISSSSAAMVKFYNGGHSGDTLNLALFINELEISPNPDPSLSLQGRDAMAVGMVNDFIIKRGGTNQAAVSVSLLSSDPAIADLPAMVDFVMSATITNFPVEGFGLGQVTIIATHAEYPDAYFDISVFDLGYDDSSYYSAAFTNGENGGLGFLPWIIQGNDGPGDGYTNFAGAFIGDSTIGGSDVNAVSGDAFALYANGQGGGLPFMNAIRPFAAELAVGEVVSSKIGVNFRNGSKGVSFENNGNSIFELGVYADDYWYKVGTNDPVSLGWIYESDTVIETELKRVAVNLYEVTIVRSGTSLETLPLGIIDLGDNAPDEVRFFNFNTDSGDSANNLYFNDLALYSGYALPVLSITGNDGTVVNQTNIFTVTRTGPTFDELTVTLTSTNESVATVVASVVIEAGESNASFEVVAASSGTTHIHADAVDCVGDTFALDVVDIAYDDTTYYQAISFANGENGGFGFDPWIITANDGPGIDYTNFAGAFIGDSSIVSGNINSSEGDAFALYANGSGTNGAAPLAQATRLFSELGIGESISLDMSVNYRNGSKGVIFQNGGSDLFEVTVFSDNYWYNIREQGDNPVPLGWPYAGDSAITIVISRTDDTAYNVNLVRSGSTPQYSFISGLALTQSPDRVRFYVYDTDAGDENNLYFNDLVIYTGTVSLEYTDGIPNTWWSFYNIPPNDQIASGDFDNDGYSNIDEYIADTNPNNNASFFSNRIISAIGKSVVSLQTGPTTNSRIYDVWWSTNLLESPQVWTPYNMNVIGNPSGGNVTLIVTNGVPYRIYRTSIATP